MSTNEQLAWDFDDGDAAEIRPDEGVTRFAPGSEQWVAALDATDDDAMRLDRLDVNTLNAEVAARLWARVAAWVEADQIAYYIDDAPVSSDAAYDARLRCLQSLRRRSPRWTIHSRPPIELAARSPTISLPCGIQAA